jgi:hypothetical protein
LGEEISQIILLYKKTGYPAQLIEASEVFINNNLWGIKVNSH